MPYTLHMPQFTETMAEGVVGKWLKNEGDWVKKDEPLVEVVTDKVTVEIPSPVEGKLTRILSLQNAVVPIGGDMAVLDEVAAGATAPETPARPEAVHVKANSPSAVRVVEAPPQHYSPIVRALAAEHQVDLSLVKGTGLGGRVTKEDVLAFVAKAGPAPATPSRAAAALGASPTPDEESIPVSPIRRLTAQHMLRSVQAAPHAWAMIEVDVNDLVKLREGLKEDFQHREGHSLTYVPFVIKAVVEALKENPILNSSWADDHIIVKKRYHIGMAVATGEGLVVPVIKDAGAKSVRALAREVSILSTKARDNKLALEDVQGGTFTVNNPGTLGTLLSMPIIHQPQAAILNMGAIEKRAVVVNDAIAIHSMMNLCLSFDHRILDGAVAARFLQRIKVVLEGYKPGASID